MENLETISSSSPNTGLFNRITRSWSKSLVTAHLSNYRTRLAEINMCIKLWGMGRPKQIIERLLTYINYLQSLDYVLWSKAGHRDNLGFALVFKPIIRQCWFQPLIYD